MLGLLISALLQAEAQTAAAAEASFTVKVADKDQAAESLIQKSEQAGGYFLTRTEQSLTLRVPAAQEKALFEHIEGLGTLLAREYKKEDLAESLESARARVRSLEGIMKRYLETLAAAGPAQVVVVEREIVGLIQQLEAAKQSVKRMERRVAFLEISVSFQFRDRRAPARDGHSSFSWINTVNLADLVEDFRNAR